MMPSLFISHGAPSLALEQNEYTEFLQDLGGRIGKPDAIVLFSAHWERPQLTFTFTDQTYQTIYDFYGFPDELYQITYPAQGSTNVATRLEQLFAAHGIPAVREEQRGLDHGAWVVLKLLFPQADIPVVAASINPHLPPPEQYRIGQALRSLGRQNILLIGSGAVTHNLRLLNWHAQEPDDWAVAFDDWIVRHVQQWDLDALFAYAERAPYARQAVPRSEHFVPLFIAMGAADERRQAQLLHRSYQYGSLSMIAFQFG